MVYEFQQLSEVDLINQISETATVLIEEQGEIKRVAKTEVGGTSGLVVSVTPEEIETLANGEGLVIIQYNGNYDPIYETLKQGGQVWIDFTQVMMGNSINMPIGTMFRIEISEYIFIPEVSEENNLEGPLVLLGMSMMLGGGISPAMFVAICPNGSYHTIIPSEQN